MPIDFRELKTFSPYDVHLKQTEGDNLRYGQFHDKIKGLPEKFQDFIFDTAPGDFIKDDISLPLGLNENQSKEAAKIVMEIMLTDWYLGDIVNQISRRLGIEEQKARTIAGLIVTELFRPILEDLKKIHVEKFAKNMPIQPQQNDDRIINLENQ